MCAWGGDHVCVSAQVGAEAATQQRAGRAGGVTESTPLLSCMHLKNLFPAFPRQSKCKWRQFTGQQTQTTPFRCGFCHHCPASRAHSILPRPDWSIFPAAVVRAHRGFAWRAMGAVAPYTKTLGVQNFASLKLEAGSAHPHGERQWGSACFNRSQGASLKV